MDVLTKLSLVALGSALGGLSRWGVTVGVARLLGAALPWGTLAISMITIEAVRVLRYRHNRPSMVREHEKGLG